MKTAICAIIKDEHRYLKEWIDYHLGIGFSHIYFFEDYGSKSHKEIVRGYSQVSIMTLEEYGIPYLTSPDGVHCHRQQILYEKAIKEIECEWLAFIDIDEFFEFENGYNLKRLCEEYKDKDGVYLCWKTMTANGQVFYVDKPVRERFTEVGEQCYMDNPWTFKSFVNMKVSGKHFRNIHNVEGLYNTAGLRTHRIRTYKKAWLNHYFTKSWEEWCGRFKRGDLVWGHRGVENFFECNPDMVKHKKDLYRLYEKFQRKPIKVRYDNAERKAWIEPILEKGGYSPIEVKGGEELYVFSLWGEPSKCAKMNLCIYGEPYKMCSKLHDKIQSNEYRIGHRETTTDNTFFLPYFYLRLIMERSGKYSREDILKLLIKRMNCGYVDDCFTAKSFCSYIVSRSSGTQRSVRSEFYKALSEYKRIDSGGKEFHNKDMRNNDDLAFMGSHKFAICFENTKEEEYVTEKLFNAFISGAVPIYWGSESAFKYFNKDAVVYVDESNFEEAIERIKFLDKNDEAYKEMLQQPMFVKGFDPFGLVGQLVEWTSALIDKEVFGSEKDSKLRKKINNEGCFLRKMSNELWGVDVAKCGCSTIGKIASSYYQSNPNEGYCTNKMYLGVSYAIDIDEARERKVKAFAVYRDPLARWKSFYKNKIVDSHGGSPLVETYNLFGKSVDEILDITEKELTCYDAMDVDWHIRKQCDFYQESDVEFIVPIEYLDSFLTEQGIEVIERQNSSGQYHIDLTSEQEERIKKLYAADYELLKSPKVWKPNNSPEKV